jgi:DNA-binding NarL/FixJ family response regulator
VSGAVRHFIEATTHCKVCDAVGDGVSAIHKATEARCDLILLNLSMPLRDSLVTVSLLRSKLPHVKIVGFSASSIDLGNQAFRETGFNAVLTHQDGLSELVWALTKDSHAIPTGRLAYLSEFLSPPVYGRVSTV